MKKTELQIIEETKAKILLHIKALTRPELFDKAFNFLITKFFDDLKTDDLDKIDKFQVCQAMLISLHKGLYEEEAYSDLVIAKRVYKILYHRMLQEATEREDIETLYESNRFYQQKLTEIFYNENGKK